MKYVTVSQWLSAPKLIQLTLLLMVGFLLTATVAEAKTIKRGVQTSPIQLEWTIVGGSGTCMGSFPSTAYPALSDNIRSTWLNTHGNAASPLTLVSASSSVLAPAGTYVFRCTDFSSGAYGEDTLIVTDCDPTEYWTGAACAPKLNQAPLAITSTEGTPPSLTLTTSGGSGTGPVTYAVVDPGTTGCTVSGNTLNLTGPGTCRVRADKDGDATYNPISSPNTDITVTPPVLPTLATPGAVQLKQVNAQCNIANGGKTDIQWSNSPNAQTYRIRVTNTVASTSVDYTQSAASQPKFTTPDNTLLDGVRYRYEVRAEAPGYQDSDWSVPDYRSGCEPEAPLNLNVMAGTCPAGGAVLTWTPGDYDPDPMWKGFKIYRDGAVIASNHGNQTTNTYTDSTVAAGSHTYRVTAESKFESFATENVIATVLACPFPNLSAGTPTRSAASVQLGQTINFSGIVGNVGTVTAGPYNVDVFYIDRTGDGNHEFTVPASNVAVNTLPGGTQTITGSWTVDLAAVLGTNYRVGYFADTTNIVDEGLGDSPTANWSGWSAPFSVVNPPPPAPTVAVNAIAPTCGGQLNVTWSSALYAARYEMQINGGAWVDVGNTLSRTLTSLPVNTPYTIAVRGVNSDGLVGSSASALGNSSDVCRDLAVGNCDIGNGSNSCTAAISWNLTGASSPSIHNVTRSFAISGGFATSSPGATTVLVRSNTLGNQATGANVIEARDVSYPPALATRTGTASCLSTSFFHTGLNNCQADPTVTILPTTPLIRSSEKATLTFRVNANYAGVTCTFSGGMSGAAPINHVASATPTDYQRTTDTLTAAQVVRVTCSLPSAPARSVTQEVRVNVVAEPQET